MVVPALARKRLIVACDGTWSNSDNGFVKTSWWPWGSNGYLQVPTNVTRICRALKPRSDDGKIEQITYYQAGVGSRGTLLDHLLGGSTGAGLSENIREAYGFIANNYQPDDEIFLLGFSRGAFTARSIGGLIGAVGVLTKQGLDDFYTIFKDWIHQKVDDQYLTSLVKAGKTRANIPIKAIGVWDTVGSLGIPSLPLFPIQLSKRMEYRFANTTIGPHVAHAFQALGLDEHRRPFSPTLWERSPHFTGVLKQTWFPGAHGNVGNSYTDTCIANLTLAWMMDNLTPMLDFDPDYLKRQHEANEAYYAKNPPQRGWGLGQIYNSYRGITVLAGSTVRTPGRYEEVDGKTGRGTGRPLQSPMETIHASVRIRWGKEGEGNGNKGAYRSDALKGWRLVPPGEGRKDVGEQRVGGEMWKWVAKGSKGEEIVLEEGKLGEVECQLARMSGAIWEEVCEQRVLRGES